MSRGGGSSCALFVVIAALCPALCVNAGAAPDEYNRRIWQTQNGLPQDTINALAQTKDGYLWIGTTGGLARFDGFRFSIFNSENTPAMREESVYSLLCARDGTLWIGTEGGGLVRYRGGVFQRFGPSEGLTNGFVRAIYEDGRLNLWAGTDRGLFRLTGSTLTRVDDRVGIPSMSVHAIHEDRRGRFLVGGSGLLVLADGTAVAHHSSRSLADNSVRAIEESNGGTLWVATIGGLHRVAGSNPAEVFSSKTVIGHNTTVLYHTKDGDLWAGTYGQGLFRYRGSARSVYEAPALLPDNNILAMLEDSEGNVWVGTQNGLLRLSRSVVTTVSTGQYDVPESIRITYADPDGSVWLTTLSGRVYRLRDSRPVDTGLPAGVASLRVRTVFRDSTGGLWLGTDGEGASRVTSAGIVRYTMKQGLINDFVRAFSEGRDGSIWIGTDSGLSRWRKNSFQNFHTAEGLAYGSIRALLEDRAGDLWVGTDGGVSRFHNGAMIRDPRLAILNGQKVWAIHEDSDGDLWFGSRGAGMFLFSDGKLTGFKTNDGLASNNIHQILEDKYRNLWMSSSSGVFSVYRAELKRMVLDRSHRPAISLYGTSEGMETNQMNGGVQPAGAISAAGEIWFPSTRGAARIDPAHTPPVGILPVRIEQVISDGREMPLNQAIDAGPGQGRVEIHYTAIRLRSSERIRFRYILEGFDAEWTEAAGRRVAYYTNVPPGRYRFRVAAYQLDHPSHSSEAAIGLNLHPRFYQTQWFLALCALLLAGAAISAYRLRVRQIHARFDAVLAERNRLAREMHDTLIQGCVGISTVLDAAASLQTSSPDVAKDLLDRARVQARESVDEARRAVWNLRHDATGAGGLVSALERLAQQVTLASGVRIAFRSSGTPVPLDAEVEHDVVMIAKEAVLNAVHHGRPQAVTVYGAFEPPWLYVRITDDGCGFEPEAAAGEHYGLVGMRERAEQIGGTFRLNTAPGKGTDIRVGIPIKQRGRVAS